MGLIDPEHVKDGLPELWMIIRIFEKFDKDALHDYM